MNYIKHLTGFFEKVAVDKTLNPTHISLYMSLFQFWNYNRFKNPISISRDEVMRISKISSKATYHKCLKSLHSNGYIKYEPSYNPFKGSHVFMFNFSENLKPQQKTEKSASPIFEPDDEQVLNKNESGVGTSIEQDSKQAVVSSINITNNSNNQNNPNDSNLVEHEKKVEEEQFVFKDENSKEEKSSAKKEEIFQPPNLEKVIEFFRTNEYPENEAKKFFNYFKSIGWLVGGKTPMVDWHAAANNWMINAPKFISNERTDRAQQFDNSAGKNYSEPL